MAVVAVCQFAGIVIRGTNHPIYSDKSLCIEHTVLDGTDIDVEVNAWHINGIDNVTVEIDDGATTISKSVSTETLSAYEPEQYQTQIQAHTGSTDPVRTAAYICSFTQAQISTLNDGEITLTITATPVSGTAKTQTFKLYNNEGGTKTYWYAYADSVSGDNGTGTASTNEATAKASPFATFEVACEQAATTANGSISDMANVIPVVTLEAGNYEIGQVGSPYPDNDTWLVVRRASNTTQSQVVIHNYTIASGRNIRARLICFDGLTIDLANASGGTSSNTFISGFTSFNSGNPDSVWFRNCKFTHNLGRSGQLTAATSIVNTTNFSGRVNATGCEFTEIAQSGPKNGWGILRDLYIHKIRGDCYKDFSFAREIISTDNGDDPSKIAVNSTTGATVGGLVYSINADVSATITEIRAGDSVIIDTSGGVVAWNFKASDAVTNNIEFYNAGDTPGVDSPAGIATHNPIHVDMIQNNIATENQFMTDCTGLFIDGQIIFLEKGLSNAAYRNIYATSSAPTGTSYLSQFGEGVSVATFEHILFTNITIPNQDLFARTEAASTFDSVLIKHCCFRDFRGDIPSADGTANGITISDCHATNPSATYTTSRGDPGLTDTVTYNQRSTSPTEKRNLLPTSDSVLVGLIASGEALTLFDTSGNSVPNDGSGAAGALQLLSRPVYADNTPTLNAFIGGHQYYIQFESPVTFSESNTSWLTTLYNGSTIANSRITGSETDRLIVEFDSVQFAPSSTLSVSWDNSSIQDDATDLYIGASTLTATLGTLIFGSQNTTVSKISRFRNPDSKGFKNVGL